MAGLGVVGALILLLGLVQFLGFEPIGQHTGVRAQIHGVFAYDDATGHLDTSRDRHTFTTGEDPAAAVNWASLPPAMAVGGAWFSGSFAEPFGAVGPKAAGDLVSSPPVAVGRKGHRSLPAGTYTFVVERYSGGRPVEVLARRTIIVAGR